MNNAPLLQLQNLSKVFTPPQDFTDRLLTRIGLSQPARSLHAVSEVNLEINKGQVVGIVGESGCGKSTLARLIAQLLTPSSGQVSFQGQDRAQMSVQQQRQVQLAVQMIFQNPYASLNPRRRVADIIMEAPLVHGLVSKQEAPARLEQLLQMVGLDMGIRHRFPHQFSGGQRQRIGIARALAVNPELIICDESVAALDVSIQAQVLNLLMELRQQRQLTYLFISHDLGVVEHLCDEVVIMYLGRIVEQAPVETLFSRPLHPYTQALLNAIPQISLGKKHYQPIQGEIPSPLNPPAGCPFHPRCPQAMPECSQKRPPLRTLSSGQRIACHLIEA
ncbi:ABC transporter ATP-binding protein [Balneatrix alpica]|uniref:ABC transporter ATP-binding protein n=1 Tax=Balneatrix alpica TaxID=75684 RepID=UPI002738541B|nr:oligopeptide/dipeptide ABC transporter ATP-binding protein [Balneatrix alpica]